MATSLPARSVRNVAFRTAIRITRWVVLIAFLLVALYFGTDAAIGCWTAHSYGVARRETTGVVTKTFTQEISTGRGNHRFVNTVDFRFTDEVGVEHAGREEVSLRRFKGLAPGSSVPVIYQAHAPAESWVVDDDEYRSSLASNWHLSLAYVAIAAAVYGFVEWWIRRERRFVRSARFTLGTVTGTMRRPAKGSEAYIVNYWYRGPTAEVLNGESTVAFAQSGCPIMVGDAVGVLYDPSRPWKNLMLDALQYVDPSSVGLV